LEAIAGALPAGEFNGSDVSARFLFPDPASEWKDAEVVATAKPLRRSRSRHIPEALHRVALLWRRAPGDPCVPPLWDLSRSETHATPAEAAAAATAVSSGIPYSEWFLCATLEILRPLVRNLFRLPRRKGKSVWATCVRDGSPCFWFTGRHMRGEHFVTQVLSSPDIVLSRMTAHEAAVRAQLGSRAGAWPPLLLLDPAAGEGNYTHHLPDGMGRAPALTLVGSYGWHALLAEPDSYTFSWLARHFSSYVAQGRVTLRQQGLTHLPTATIAPLYTLDARVPELEATFEHGLPPITRQRLQWGSSTYKATALSVRGDLWLYNHLAGGPVAEALELAGFHQSAAAFQACKQGSAKLRRRCYNASVVETNLTFLPWTNILDALPPPRRRGPIDLLVLDQRDPYVTDLLLAFPLRDVKPSLLYFRTSAGSAPRRHLLANGYQVSAHFETSAWGENTLAWRADRCHAAGMPGRPAWADAHLLQAARDAMTRETPAPQRVLRAGVRGPRRGRKSKRPASAKKLVQVV